jgi:hypothetical protein
MGLEETTPGMGVYLYKQTVVVYRLALMSLTDAVNAFTDWSRPWTFDENVRKNLDADDAGLFDTVCAEASKPEYWQKKHGYETALAETKKRFPTVDGEVIAAVVRAASYDWR